MGIFPKTLKDLPTPNWQNCQYLGLEKSFKFRKVNRIGTNINQIAKYINTNEEISIENYKELQESLTDIKSLVDEKFNKEITQIEKFLKEREE